jgi:hypothetical protein
MTVQHLSESLADLPDDAAVSLNIRSKGVPARSRAARTGRGPDMAPPRRGTPR